MARSIRSYTPADFTAGRALWDELTQRHRDIYEDQSIGGDDPGAAFEPYLAMEGLRGPWVAEVDGKVVGLTGLLLGHGWNEAEIEPVVVSAQYRSQGIGEALVQRALAEARAVGVSSVTVRPVARNVEAIAFFVQAGFGAVGHIDLFLDISADADRQLRPGITLHGHSLKY
jgi:N-acetylglutamate synthase-like GNAT family acetyltransferase